MSRADPAATGGGVRVSPRSSYPSRQRGSLRAVRVGIDTLFRVDSMDFVWLLSLTLFMVVFGLFMVLSSSYVTSYADGSNFLSKFLGQATYAFIGIPLMLVLSRLPHRFWNRFAFSRPHDKFWYRLPGALLFFACILQALAVFKFSPFAYEVNGHRNWFEIGPIVFQPSELIKFTLVLWMGTLLARRQYGIKHFRQAMLPVLIVSVCAIGLVLLGGDLGTTMILLLMVVGALLFAGVSWTKLFLFLLACAAAVGLFAVAAPRRMENITAFLHPELANPNGAGYQILQAHWGMANGGIWGVGLGNSESKWSWLPASSTDFIFAIIAEELGLIGACLVLVLFIALGVVLSHIVRNAPTPFARIVTGTVLLWLMGQSFINVAVVEGLFPVLGVPLPLISQGGTALISVLAMLGIVLSFTRGHADDSSGFVSAAGLADPLLSSPARRSQAESTLR